MKRPLISVIIPVYNRADKLKRALESVLNQTETDLEALVIDDGSDDDAEAAANSFSDPRVRYARQSHAGACAARNRGIALAKGEYIAFQDSDDFWRPQKLQKQLLCIGETGADAVYGRLARTHGDGTVSLYPAHTPAGFMRKDASPFGIGTQTLLVRREVFEKYLFDPAMPRFQELEWLCRVRKEFRVYGMADIVADYAPGEDSISADSDALQKAAGMLLEKHPNLFQDSPAAREAMKDCLMSEAERAFRRNDPRYRACLAWAVRVGGLKEKALRCADGLNCYSLYLRAKDKEIKKRIKELLPVRALKAFKRTFDLLKEAEALRRFPEKRRVFGMGTALSLLLSQSVDIVTRWHTHFYHAVLRHFCDKEFSDLADQLKSFPVVADAASGPVPVWTLWWDGETAAPECVKMCLASQRRFFPAPDYDWHVLTKDDYDRYISLPPAVLERYREGEISLTHLSDVIRCALLHRYGGLWIDSTVYVSGQPDEAALKASYYTNRKTTYPENLRRLIPGGRWACYLMGCRAGNPLTAFLTMAYARYWEKYGEPIDYYLLDDLLDAAWRLLPAARALMEQAEIGNQRIFDLYEMRNAAYRPDRLEALFRENAFHKLSHKGEYRPVTAEGKRTVWACLREDAGREV